MIVAVYPQARSKRLLPEKFASQLGEARDAPLACANRVNATLVHVIECSFTRLLYNYSMLLQTKAR
ncbi:MAG: hypothetical protein C0507_10160 [Cyanobacteria bacterium PR.3.49]|nr:hypothetical protein [Cyanobacteria bacterium PR.3.49]